MLVHKRLDNAWISADPEVRGVTRRVARLWYYCYPRPPFCHRFEEKSEFSRIDPQSVPENCHRHHSVRGKPHEMPILEVPQELSGAPKSEPPGAPGAPRSEFPGAPGLAPDPATLGAPRGSPELPNPSPYLSDLTDHGVYLGVGGSGEAT